MSFENGEEIGREILQACRNEIYMNLPYLNQALFALEFKPGDSVTVSAATNGRELYYSAAFMADIYMRSGTLANRLYLHIILHCMLRHIFKKKGKAPELWDLACDAAVESILDSLNYPCLTGNHSAARQIFYGECRSELKVLTAEGIYRILLRKSLSEYELAKLQRLFIADDHGLWDMQKEEESQQQDNAWKKISSQTQTAMQTVLSEQANGGEAVLEQVRISARNDLDYRAFLLRFAAPHEIIRCDADSFDYIYYTYGLSVYGNMPLIEPPETKEEKRIEDFVIAIDTSMSTSGEMVREFLQCTYSILLSAETFTRRLNIRLIQCDNMVRSDVEIHSLKELKEYMEHLELNGGSATDFRPVFEHVDALKKEGAFSSLRGILYFTDGMGIYPEKRPDYDAAFIMLQEPPLAIKMPPWCIKVLLDIPALERAEQSVEELWAEENLQEMPDL